MAFKIYDFIYQHYKWFVLIPLSLVILSATMLALSYNQNGEFLKKGIEFTGGTQIRISQQAVSRDKLVEILSNELGKNTHFSIHTLKGGENEILWEVETQQELNESEVGQMFVRNGIEADTESNMTGSGVAAAFFSDAVLAVLIAFVIMSSVVFIAFREFVPSLIIILASFADIFISVGAMAALGIPLTLGSLAALLMLIGYSVDTDILLSFRVLKDRKGSFKERNLSAIKTGLTMSGSAIMAVAVLFLVSYFTAASQALVQISSVLFLGLTVDTVSTWLQNSVVFKYYMEGRK